ncbi:MAG: hypothetical protein PHT99_09800 [Methanoregula sp.]|nr:hypothetical protein [Methanoregula sp.]
MKRHDRAVSETFSVVIITLLVIVAAVLLVASLTGVITNLLLKPALFSVQTVQYETSAGTIIGLFHQEGDAVNLKGTSQTKGVSIVSLVIIDPDGAEHQINAAHTSMVHDSWGPGNLLYIYQSGGSYVYSDDVIDTSGLDLTGGTYTVKITDDNVHVLIHTLPITIQ